MRTGRTPGTTRTKGVAVTAHAVHVPGLDPTSGRVSRLIGRHVAEQSCGPEQAHKVLGRKGLLYKEESTRLALCAVHRTFGLPPGKLTEPLPGAAHTAVVVSSNLGNVQTVRDVVAEMRAGSAHDVSPLHGPNASSNVIASTVAIRYGFTGPNLMVCSGSTSGLDAVRLGVLLLRAERARRVVVVGVEPADEMATRVAALTGEGTSTSRLRQAAACVVLEPQRDDTPLLLGPVLRHRTPSAPPGQTAPALRLTPPGAGDSGVIDVGAELGEMYGALGVVQLAMAASWLTAEGSADGTGVLDTLVTCGDPDDGYASVRLESLRRPATAGAH